MASLVLAVNPILAGWGQFAAIVICFYILVFVIITVAFNLVMVFALSFLRQKAELIKKLRPTVESINHTTEAALQGTPPAQDSNAVARIVASVPPRLHTVDQQVEKASDRVADGVIEFRARTLQVQAVVKSFLRPRHNEPKQLPQPRAADAHGLEFQSPGYRMLMEQQSAQEGNGAIPTATNGRAASQERTHSHNVASH